MITEKSLMITSMLVCSSMLDADGDDCNDAFELEADIAMCHPVSRSPFP